MDQIYLDFNATTPIAPEVADEMRPFLDIYFGNPSSSHIFGVKAREAVEHARRRVALLLNCRPEEIVFTSGGTESNNMAIKGAAFALRSKGNHIIISAVEHPAVTEVASYLSANGFRISVAPVDEFGRVAPEDIARLLRPETILVSVMHANNEVGTINPISEISAIVHRHGALMHTDAAQAVGKIPVDVQALGVDMLSLAGHKLYAPKGVGALFLRSGVTIEKLIHGADHEQNMRAGTENVLEIAGLGKACELAFNRLDSYRKHTLSLRKRFLTKLASVMQAYSVNGHPEYVLPNTLSIGFRDLVAQTLLLAMPELAVSAGAACHTGDEEVSSVLGAMNVDPAFSQGTIRFSFGISTTEKEIDTAVAAVARAVHSLSPDAKTTKPDQPEDIKLTHFTHGLGCACKIGPGKLDELLAKLPKSTNPNILIGTENKDDAAAYKISDQLVLLQTVDFLTPVVDNPRTYGEIAAANSLSDIYAKGGKPAFALSVVAFPVNRLPISVMSEILEGAAEKAAEAGVDIIGGHSVEDNEPKFGLVVTGFAHPSKIISNAGARKGDLLILTKPVGTGIISTAVKMGMADKRAVEEAENSMKMLNKTASELLCDYQAHACTDITGFGLAGHAHEMAFASKMDIELIFNEIPFLHNVREYALAGAVPGGTKSNLAYIEQWIDFGKGSLLDKYLLCDAQTSGGLLISMPSEQAKEFVKVLEIKGVRAAVIGRVKQKGIGRITIV